MGARGVSPCRDSNPDLELRRFLHYPLCYRGLKCRRRDYSIPEQWLKIIQRNYEDDLIEY